MLKVLFWALVFAAIGAPLFSVGCCAQMTATRDWLAEPQTAAAVSTLQHGATAFVCQVSDVAAAVASDPLGGNGVWQADIDKVYTATSKLCHVLNGSVVTTARIP